MFCWARDGSAETTGTQNLLDISPKVDIAELDSMLLSSSSVLMIPGRDERDSHA